MVRVNACCCGCSLRYGAQLIGLWDLLALIVLAITLVSSFDMPSYYTDTSLYSAYTFLGIIRCLLYLMRVVAYAQMVWNKMDYRMRKIYFVIRSVTIPLQVIFSIIQSITLCNSVKNWISTEGLSDTYSANCSQIYGDMLFYIFLAVVVDSYLCLVLYSFWKESPEVENARKVAKATQGVVVGAVQQVICQEVPPIYVNPPPKGENGKRSDFLTYEPRHDIARAPTSIDEKDIEELRNEKIV